MKIVIIGGVSGGSAAALRLRRLDENAEITVVERGHYPAYANSALPYYTGGVMRNREQTFAAALEALRHDFNIKLLTEHNAVAINRQTHEVTAEHGGTEVVIPYDKLVLATGSSPVVPSFARDVSNVFTLGGVEDADAIVAAIENCVHHSALVVGAGYSGLQMVENLSQRGLAITLVEARDQIMPHLDPEIAMPLLYELRQRHVTVKLGTMVAAARMVNNALEVGFTNGQVGYFDFAVVCAGRRPNTVLAAQCALPLTGGGHIRTNEYMQTGDTDIYAIGDVAGVSSPVGGELTALPQAGPVNLEVRAMCSHLYGQPQPFRGLAGAAVAKLFAVEAACCGLTDKEAARRRISGAHSVWVHERGTQGLYPNIERTQVKLTFDSEGRVLGAQAVGRRSVDHIVNAVSAVLSEDGTVHDLACREQAYTSPFSLGRGLLNLAGAVAENAVDGLYRLARYDQLNSTFRNAYWLDVRPPEQFAEKHLPGFVNIPFKELRERLDEIPRDRQVLILCLMGLKSYEASRILTGRGYEEVYVLSGGMLTLAAAGLV
ncbi:MAG: FAD-dependent oxidoreductase [Succinivibrio sp.]|nr:FAD-dependent oxidoreductase [Succinivibrio sp.]